jgi:multisubunit Na+/H+ antiporter MnhG subunit
MDKINIILIGQLYNLFAIMVLSYFNIFSVFEEDNNTTVLGIIMAIFGFVIMKGTLIAVVFFLEKNNQK